ncbi:membrane-associated phospholipid phosphatase [Nonomuraea roseoviolacea subsp. carminata]|uniref:Membrane-associated phospholipid phosphatase n=1 Tax=Nonomuraea roseoviolacea subsp. carminata TaxID=160689 RepID=A0ABT1JT98_9ACTN|nr:membrane-associated phospholipid phosphatase [Nonomuraea roseoviolacea subsp. carminata]
MRSGTTSRANAGRPWFWIAISSTLLVLGVMVGFAARSPGWTAADARASELVQSIRSPGWTAVAQVLNVGFGTAVGSVLVGVLVVAVVVWRPFRPAWSALVVIAAGWCVSPLVKTLVARPRPPAGHALVHELGPDSFPSGHVCLTLAIVVAVALLARNTRLFLPVLVVGCVLVIGQMLARVYLGAHYPSDTLGSLILTPAAIMLAVNAFRLSGRELPPFRAATSTDKAASQVTEHGERRTAGGSDRGGSGGEQRRQTEAGDGGQVGPRHGQ